ncbi:MAG: sulfite exporter TauE/SafE family protein [Acidimicrobiales bacterium]
MDAELAVIVGAISIGFFVKAITGMGGPLVSVPIIAAVTGVEHAVVVVSIANLVANAWLLWEHRSGAREAASLLAPMLAAGVVGTVLGTWLLTRLDDRILSVALALIIVAYILRFLTNPSFQIERSTGRLLAVPVGAFGGVLLGATSSAGPLFATYVHGLRLKRSTFVFALSTLFEALGTIQVVTLVSLGRFTAPRVGQAVVGVIPVLVATPLGIAVSRRLGQPAFERAVLVLLALAAISLVRSTLA